MPTRCICGSPVPASGSIVASVRSTWRSCAGSRISPTSAAASRKSWDTRPGNSRGSHKAADGSEPSAGEKNFGVPFEARPDTVSTSPRSNRRDAGEKRRTAARHDSEAAAQECDRPELTHDETGVAEYVTCSDDSADRHRTPRATRIAQASFHSPGNSRCTELVISPDAVPVPPPSRCPTKSALLLPLSLGLLAAACGNPSASPAGRTEDAARLVSSASPTPSVDPVLQWNSLHGCCARSAFVSLDGSDAAARE